MGKVQTLEAQELNSGEERKQTGLKSKILIAATVGAAVIIATVTGLTLLKPNPDEDFIAKLVASGLADSFASESSAITEANDFCWSLKSGSPVQGEAAQEIAVQIYCPEYKDDFRLLKPFSVSGSISIESDGLIVSIQKYGKFCEGYIGVQWFSRYTDVKVTDSDGTILAETTLKRGDWLSPNCTFQFSFTVMEGEASYNLQFANLKSTEFTEEQLKDGPLALRWGSE
jgi:hypothetical protein